jgi:hypothetical protein
MKYKLFLDDERYPPDNDAEWRIARNFDDACWYIREYGLPYHISFDHDLAFDHYILGKPHERTGLDVAKWFANHVIENGLKLKDFTFYVHSQNPVGAENIQAYMEQFLKLYREGLL